MDGKLDRKAWRTIGAIAAATVLATAALLYLLTPSPGPGPVTLSSIEPLQIPITTTSATPTTTDPAPPPAVPATEPPTANRHHGIHGHRHLPEHHRLCAGPEGRRGGLQAGGIQDPGRKGLSELSSCADVPLSTHEYEHSDGKV